ncbi:MAG: LacI family transcriptional regulator [Chloroflexota bacterium]|nr:LacI family transcriptional regulator [Chloroflexota bacterium]
MRRRSTTIRDVAERVGVSVSTVSHVLNGNDQHVGSAVRKRVMDVVEELNYRPNAIARSMVKRQTATVGLIITEVANPLFVPVVEGVEEVLRGQGYHIVLASAPDVESEVEAIETLRAQQVDGFIFMSLSFWYPSDHLARLQEDGVPFVVINRPISTSEQTGSEINQVQLDDWGAGYSATRHLLDLGHTRVGTVSGPIDGEPARRSAIERHRGWQEALQERGLSAQPEWVVVGDYTYEGGYQAIRQILARVEGSGVACPTALFVASDVMAMAALKALHQAGKRVPQDIAIVTTGDPPFATYTIPSLTTLSHPVPEAGRLAARILLDWFKEGKPAHAQNVTLSFTLKVRESCGALA